VGCRGAPGRQSRRAAYESSWVEGEQFGGTFKPRDFALPQLPIEQLGPVVKVMLGAQMARLGIATAPRARAAFAAAIGQVEKLADVDCGAADWRGDTCARMNFIVGEALHQQGLLASDDAALRNSVYRNMLAFGAWQGSAYALERANALSGFALGLNSLNSIQPDFTAVDAGVRVLRAALAEYPPDADPRDIASLQWMLAGSLETLSQARVSDNYAEAIGLYRSALKAFPKERDPWMWSSINYGLAVTLGNLGKQDAGIPDLTEAIAILNDTLTVRTHDAMPYEWALTQQVLGESFRALAVIEPGHGYEAQAIAAEKSALEVLTPQADPDAWARAHVTLGVALSGIGQEDNAPEKLQEAISALRRGATKDLRARAPIAWAEAQDALAVALLTLGSNESNEEASSGSDWRRFDRQADEHLQEAVAAARAGLEETSEKRAPHLWAELEGQLGATLETIGEREEGRGDAVALDHFDEAAEAERSALRVLTPKNDPHNWANAECEIGDALESLGEHKASVTLLEQAVAADREALTVQTLDKGPADWSDDEDRLAYALERLGMLEKGDEGIPHLQEAVEDLEVVVKTRSPDRDLDAWLVTERNLARAEAELGRRETDTRHLEQSAQTYREELKYLSAERSPADWKVANDGLNDVLNQLHLRGAAG